ncbi:helix-turn-helix transcriptional regulator [Cohnella cholangitidis]|uniref:Helix-turn-helix domain-containing protein n=1 Tax=Cohnella cholangitidis TaxID=2598458 RepID=A0A7G5BSN9_9BACL|nr:helix-turn-helix transcriptional regulator [Cohnella cholangitidis]QMV39973.1 helix-turn-helix domain-containing protein [Cohnella cholangitidis]
MANESYTTEEVAKLLKISKLTVYDLLKKGELPSYRVGKQMRVDAADLEAFKLRSKGGAVSEQTAPLRLPQAAKPVPGSLSIERPLVITGQDISLDILSKHMEKHSAGIRPLRSYNGSMDSLVSMYRGEADIVSTHLLDGDSGQYNLPYIRKLFVGQSYVVARLLSRSAGLYVKKGNPKKISDWEDLAKPGVRIVNREKGSGARVLLDEQLRIRDYQASRLGGYEHEENTHLAVAGRVASGEADAGVGIEKAAQLVGGIDFIPLIQEKYDLVMLKRPDNAQWIESVLAIIRSESFKSELQMIQGYDLSQTGQILLDT